MAARDDEAAIGRLALHHVGACQERPVGHAAQHLDQPRRRAEQKPLARRHRAVERDGERFHIAVVHGVDHDPAVIPHRAELRGDTVDIHGAQLLQRDRRHIRRAHRAAGLFLDVLPQFGGAVAEGPVLRELRFARGRQLISVTDVVDVIQRIAPALLEKGAQHLAVDLPAAAGVDRIAQRLGLQRVVSAQRRVAAAQEQERRSRLLRDAADVLRDLAVRFDRLLRCEAAGVGQQEKEPRILGKALPDALHAPVGVDGHAVNGLHARRVVVQHHELRPALRQLPRQQRVEPRLVHRRTAQQRLRGDVGLVHRGTLLCVRFFSYSIACFRQERKKKSPRYRKVSG